MEDLTGLGKIAEVIVGALAKATGTLYAPRKIRLEGKAKADAEAYAIERITEAEVRADEIRRTQIEKHLDQDTALVELRERAGRRVLNQEIRRQHNLELITAEGLKKAAEFDAAGASTREIDPDWMDTFIEYAQNVSEERLRQLWSQILATQAIDGRTKVSKATLDSIRLIEPEQAFFFERSVRLFLATGQIMDVGEHGDQDVAFNINLPEVSALEDLGLLKKLRDNEISLEVREGVLTFWREEATKDGSWTAGAHWNNDEHRDEILRLIVDMGIGLRGDPHKFRQDLRIERMVLTTRGFELANIIMPTFKEIYSGAMTASVDTLGDYADQALREEIVLEWACNFCRRGVVVIHNVLQSFEDKDVAKKRYLPSRIYVEGAGIGSFLDLGPIPFGLSSGGHET